MILKDDLKPGVEYRIQNGAHLTAQDIVRLISEKASNYGIPMDFRVDYIADNLFEGLLKLLTQECLVLYNAEYGRKAAHYTIRMNTQGTYLFVTCNQHIFCPSQWGTIVDDIMEELFQKGR